MGVDFDKMLALAEEKGWHVERKGGRHIEVRSPDGKQVVTGSRTPGDHRAGLNLRADLRRAGLDIPAQIDAKQDARRREGSEALTLDEQVQTGGRAHKGELTETVRTIFTEQPGHVFTLEELWTRVHARVPAAKRTSTEQTVYTMAARNEVKRLDRGQYRWIPGEWKQGRYVPKEDEPPASTQAPFQSGGIPAGAPIGDAELEEDARVLDEALATLGRMQERIVERVRALVEEEVQRALEPLAKIDTVVRRNREVLAHIARARAALRVL